MPTRSVLSARKLFKAVILPPAGRGVDRSDKRAGESGVGVTAADSDSSVINGVQIKVISRSVHIYNDSGFEA